MADITAVSKAAAKYVKVLLYRSLGGDGEHLLNDFTETVGAEYYKITVQVNALREGRDKRTLCI